MGRNVTLLTVNEAPALFPFCSTLLCDWKTVREYYKDSVDGCDLSGMCAGGGRDEGVSGGGVGSHACGLIWLIAICMILY